MKNLANESDRRAITARINALTADSKARWGQMDVGQMLAHCQRPLELAISNPKPPRNLLGRLLGSFAKAGVYGEKPYKKNGYTPPPFKIIGPQEFAANKEKLLTLIERFPKEISGVELTHPFFGPLAKEEWGWGQYKHLDHHLQQFGV
jgi:hypothetical protein